MFEFIYNILDFLFDLVIKDIMFETYILTGLTGIIIGFAVINGVLGGVLALIWGERRLLGRFQQRTGPNRWGPQGILTSTADAVKVMFKEDIVPESFIAGKVAVTVTKSLAARNRLFSKLPVLVAPLNGRKGFFQIVLC